MCYRPSPYIFVFREDHGSSSRGGTRRYRQQQSADRTRGCRPYTHMLCHGWMGGLSSGPSDCCCIMRPCALLDGYVVLLCPDRPSFQHEGTTTTLPRFSHSWRRHDAFAYRDRSRCLYPASLSVLGRAPGIRWLKLFDRPSPPKLSAGGSGGHSAWGLSTSHAHA